MNRDDPNGPILELMTAALGSLCDELVLVGGCSVGLLITDGGRPPVRQTVDVDLVAEVASTIDYYTVLMPKLKAQGFKESPDEANMCRWKNGSLILDVMPSKEEILGHSTNRWYDDVIRSAHQMLLPSGRSILVVSAPLFIATKLVAFHDRGNGDYGSHDMEDIINLVDGRPELLFEVSNAAAPVLEYIREEFELLITDTKFMEQLPMHLQGGAAEQARAPILIERLRKLGGL